MLPRRTVVFHGKLVRIITRLLPLALFASALKKRLSSSLGSTLLDSASRCGSNFSAQAGGSWSPRNTSYALVSPRKRHKRLASSFKTRAINKPDF